MKKRIPFAFTSLVGLGLLLGFGHSAQAALVGSMQPRVRLFDTSLSPRSSFLAYGSSFRGGVRVALADTDGDGVQEIITVPGRGGGPEVRIFNDRGELQSRFFAYGKKFRGGLNLAAYDLDRDGRSEIITAPGKGGGPEIKIWRSDGTLLESFFAFDQGFRGGVNVTAGAFGKKQQALIAAGSGYGSAHVRFFTPNGSDAGLSFFPFGKTQHGVVVAELAAVGQRSKLIVAPERSVPAEVKIFGLDNVAKPIRTFIAFPKTFHGGVQLASSDLNGDGQSEILVAAGVGGEPKVRQFSSTGTLQRSLMAHSRSFRGGVHIAANNGLVATGPGAIALEGRTDLVKYIEIDLSDQTLKYFENGRLLGTHRVSTGKWMTPTPIGTFAIKNKIPVAYSRAYDLYMEWWMAFTKDGSYGIHALPYWKTKTGGKYYEGVGHLGTPVSHGCIRQTLAEAKTLFDWADIGTTVIVRR